MGLLDRLSTRTPPKSAVELPRLDRLDPFLGDVELRTAYRALVDGDWPRLERFLDVSPKSWMFSPIVTSELVGLETITFERWMEFKHSARSRSFHAAVLVRDAFSTHREAIDAPSNGHDHTEVTRFTEQLRSAERSLYEVVTDRPAMADPWVTLLITGRGLQVSLEELRERFDNAHSRAPFRPDACRQYLQSLTKKWNGSNVATFDFARWIEKETAPASPAREALPTAHIEKGLLEQGRANLATYLVQPEVVAELATGLLAFLQATPSPAPTEALGVLNAYALAITADGQSTARLVTETFARIDNRPTEFPWSIYADDITHVFSEIQADQLRFASRY